MECAICKSVSRDKIEADLLSGEPLENIVAKGYGKFTLDELRVHAVAHMDLPMNGDSIATRLAVREADLLSKVNGEYFATLKKLGRLIGSQLECVEDGSATVSQALSKSVVDLYLGAGNQIRETVKLLAETYADMNADDGERDNKSSLNKLVLAINRSRETA